MRGTMGLFSCIIFFIILSFFQFSLAKDTIKQGQSIKNTETLVSSGGNFELGFFSPSNSKNYYLGIWFKKIPLQTVVWVANRGSPLTSSSFLTINNNGNLVIFDGLEIVTTLTFNISNGNTSATLLDSGNFVLKGDGNLDTLWQSFDYPTDTLLPGMKIGLNLMTGLVWSLTSWKSMDDPSPGSFSLKLDSQGLTQVSIWKGEFRYWSSGVWDGKIVSGPENILPIVNYSYITNNIESYFTYVIYNTSIIQRYFLDFSGLLKRSIWLEDLQQWKVLRYEPSKKCDVYGHCGAFAYCNQNASVVCGCLHGFEPRSARDWDQSDWSGGCVRRTPLQCGNTSNIGGEKNKDGFSQILNMKFPINSRSLAVGSEEECKFACLHNCSCGAYAYGYRGCSTWDGDILNLVPLVDDHSVGGNLYLRLAASELLNSQGNKIPSSTEGKKTSFSDSGTIRIWLIVALPIVLVILISIAFMCRLWIIKLNRKEKKKSQDLLLFDLAIGIKATYSEQVDSNIGKGGTNDVELPLFSFASIIASTGNFSATNKLGEGGFGPVYKGKLLRGQEVAVKRLSRTSGQGFEEFKNETTLIAKLQHRNLVRILGCCIEDGENILIYEYMSNKSLDCFLFDPTKRELLDWTRRIHIIEGIAQGLLYLHQYSRVRIIHRDLKASNILLDGDMNPKISDFGLARIFGGNESHANTKRIVGTYGYMSPEYANRGHFSIKSDVFSFGVLLLEILSGRKNSDFCISDAHNLIASAWKLWNSNRGMELVDPMMGNSYSMDMLTRYINVALLCVEESATDRPTMSDVVSMLSNGLATPLPSPKHHAYSTGQVLMNSSSKTKESNLRSINNLTITVLDGR